MEFMNWTNKFVKNMKWYDISLVKLSVFFFTLFLITIWAGFRTFVLSIGWPWYLLVFVIVTIPLMKKMFFD